jgi:hypothetical protein
MDWWNLAKLNFMGCVSESRMFPIHRGYIDSPVSTFGELAQPIRGLREDQNASPPYKRSAFWSKCCSSPKQNWFFVVAWRLPLISEKRPLSGILKGKLSAHSKHKACSRIGTDYWNQKERTGIIRFDFWGLMEGVTNNIRYVFWWTD